MAGGKTAGGEEKELFPAQVEGEGDGRLLQGNGVGLPLTA